MQRNLDKRLTDRALSEFVRHLHRIQTLHDRRGYPTVWIWYVI